MNLRTNMRLVFLVTLVLSLIQVRSHADDASLQQLINDLKNGTAEEATRAAYSLGELGPDAVTAIPRLIEALNDTRPQSDVLVPNMPTVGSAAAEALTYIGEAAIAPLLTLLHDDGDIGAQLLAITTLASMKTVAAGAEPMLRTLAGTHSDESIRINAFNAVPHVSVRAPEDIVTYLQERLYDLNPEVRALAVDWLGHYGSEAQSAVPQLITALDDDAWHWEHVADVGWQVPLRGDAAEALGRIGPSAKAALPRLREMMREDGSVRMTAANSVAQIDQQDTECIGRLVAALEVTPEHKFPSIEALKYLANMPERSQAAVAKVKALTRFEAPGVRQQAMRTLRVLIGPKALSTLIQALTDEDKTVRRTAAEQLGELGPSAASAVDDLLPLLQSKEDRHYGRKAAVEALVKIGQPKDVIVPALCDALHTPNFLGDDLFAIVDALKQLDAADRAVETLEALIESTDNDTRREKAQKALRQFQSN